MEAATTLLDAEAVGDLVLLDPLTEESLLRTLQERFRRSDIYVGIGTGPRGWVVGQGAAGGCAGVGGERRDPAGSCRPCVLTRHPTCPQTYIGDVVISVNPYRPLPIYTPEKVQEYNNCNFFAVKPHM